MPVVFWRDDDDVEYLIDGRNRLKICQEHGVSCSTRLFKGSEEEAISHAFSLNAKRRHATPSQLSMAGGKLTEMFTAAAKKRQKKGTSLGKSEGLVSTDTKVGNADDSPGRSRAKAASIVGVSQASIARAQKVIQDAPPAVQAAVQANEVSVRDAYQVADEPEDVQEKALEAVRSGAAITMNEYVGARK